MPRAQRRSPKDAVRQACRCSAGAQDPAGVAGLPPRAVERLGAPRCVGTKMTPPDPGAYSAVSPLTLPLRASRSRGGTLTPGERAGAWGMGGFEAGVAPAGVGASWGARAPQVPDPPFNKGPLCLLRTPAGVVRRMLGSDLKGQKSRSRWAEMHNEWPVSTSAGNAVDKETDDGWTGRDGRMLDRPPPRGEAGWARLITPK